MYRIFTIILTFHIVNSEVIDDGRCNDFHADFEPKLVDGFWYVTSIFPEPTFPVNQTVLCNKVEFSETDVGGLRWLINKTNEVNAKSSTKITGPVIRQRYYSEKPYDVWSEAVEGVNGCFEKVLSLSSSGQRLETTNSHKQMMQLHVIGNGEKPLLLQLLWGKAISAVVYSKNKDVTSKQMESAKRIVKKLRGPPPEPKFCDEFNVKILNYTQKY